ACPDVARLRGLLDSSLPDPEQAELTGHLDSCECCQEQLEELAASGSSWPPAARPPADARPPSGSAFWPKLQELQREVAGPAVATADPPTVVAPPDSGVTGDHADQALDFLDPPEKPDYSG